MKRYIKEITKMGVLYLTGADVVSFKKNSKFTVKVKSNV